MGTRIISEFKSLVIMFTSILSIIFPIVVFSVLLFPGTSLESIPKPLIYSVVFSFILGVVLFIASLQLSKIDKEKINKLGFGQGGDAIVLFIPYVIYLGIKRVITK